MVAAILLAAAALVCFAVAFLIAVGEIHGNHPAWLSAGLAMLAASVLVTLWRRTPR